ncbi:MAG: hypothetical protein E7012_05220 [Alphaproteobacteria bacterium]|nr:hypothetical protein [Alphaproteobacteria bacterium]
MENISALIREAKPLYLARKRQKRIISSSLLGIALLWGGIYTYQPTTPSYPYYWDSEFNITDNTSVIEEMGLPTDDYGLLLVG